MCDTEIMCAMLVLIHDIMVDLRVSMYMSTTHYKGSLPEGKIKDRVILTLTLAAISLLLHCLATSCMLCDDLLSCSLPWNQPTMN